MRRIILRQSRRANVGHIGCCLCVGEILAAIYGGLLKAASPGDPDRDGFVEYHRADEQGLVNQGWKDSYDAIFHADDSIAQGPTALCEVQGYIYAAMAFSLLVESLNIRARSKRQAKAHQARS